MHTRLLLFGRLYHCVPHTAFLVYCIKEHEFCFAAGSFFYSINACTTNTAVVKNHKSINNAFKGYLQGSDRIRAIVNYSTAEGLLVPALFAFGLSFPYGTTGVWFYFLAGEVISLLGFSILKWKRAHRIALNMDVYLDFKKGFGVGPEDMLEFDIKTMAEVTAVSETAQKFCIEHGQSELTGMHVALCIEEMAGNTIKHGFSPKGRNNLSVRIQDHDDRWIIRFRDDCRAFDPLHYVFKDTDSPASGIRLMMKIADEARYTYSMNLNNLMIVINSSGKEGNQANQGN